ncbi:MAG: histidine phosphatase family protein [Actinomycetota bacterium]
MPTELILVRHGDPSAGGVEDPGLSDTGHRQAAATAEQLVAEPLVALYTSPLRRATESAEPLAAAVGLEPVVDERIAEFDHGQVYYSEKHAAEMDAGTAMAKLAAMRSPEFRERVLAGFGAIEAAHPDGMVAAVCHGGVISILVGAAVYNDSLIFLPEYGSVTRRPRSGPSTAS